MHISFHVHELPLAAPASPDSRCALELDAAVSTLYGYGGCLFIEGRRARTASEAMRILAAVPDSRLKAVASMVSCSLCDVFRVSASFNRSLWASPNGNDEVLHAPPQHTDAASSPLPLRQQDAPESVSLLSALRYIRDHSRDGVNALSPLLGMSLGNNVFAAADHIRARTDGTQETTIRRIEELCRGKGFSISVDLSLQEGEERTTSQSD